MMASTGGSQPKGETAVSTAAAPTQTELKTIKTDNVGFVAPPRTSTDITELLDKQKPDATKVAKLTAQAEAPPPANLKPYDLADFYYNRAQARSQLGRNQDAITDAELAVKYGQGDDFVDVVSRYEQFLMRRLQDAGQGKRSREIADRHLAAFANKNKGRLFGLTNGLLIASLQTGDIARAEQYAARNRALLNEAKSWPSFSVYATSYQATVEEGNGRLAEAKGQYAEAEQAYQKAALLYAQTIGFLSKWPSAPPQEEYERYSDYELAFAGRAKVKQGRIGEGEADVRRAVLNRLSKNGKYHPDAAGMLGIFVYVLQEQGRYDEAEKLERQIIEIYKGLGYADDAPQLVNANLAIANLLNLQRRYDDAAALYDQIDASTRNWDPVRRDAAVNNLSRVVLTINKGNPAQAVEIAKSALERERARSGEKSFNTALARGFLAAALGRAGKTDEAFALYRVAIPLLMAGYGGSDTDSGATAAAREGRIRFVVEAYLALLGRNPALISSEAADEVFGYVDVMRSQSVQRALQASSLRSVAANPALADLVRVAQDSDKQLGAATAAENNLLAQPSGERDEAALKQVQAQIAKLQVTRAEAQKDIAQKFPDYANLTKPAPPTPQAVQQVLADDEALVSFYFGRFDGIVSVVRKGMPIKIARLGMSAGQLETEVNKLREALEPQAAMISDIPPFDLKRAYALYEKLLKPVEDAWKPAKSLIVATNGALGLLPLSLLPTAPAEIKTDDNPLFSSYRSVPWLARTHAVTLVPSAAALMTLRHLPPPKPGRKELIAFGDPIFSAEEDKAAATEPAKVADAGNVTRGVPLKRRSSPQLDGVNSADLAMLPRLPDTADELKSIALALKADPTEALHLGKDANEQAVKSLDLSGFKVLAFATHGLVPGELDGLTQPALALSAPAVAGVGGDGLLTMEEILTLKLDADWVVLSACNTGAGAGAGAEAASGLGRAFFYAGTKALLVTNWSVHSQSARELVTDLFKRQADDPNLTRGEALRQAMMALVDGPGYLGSDGKTTEFAYAHPLFWAPYSIIGDGGRR
jgi:CHAT domain-containing protein